MTGRYTLRPVDHEHLYELIAGIFSGRGLSERDSGIVAGSLVHANLRGVDSHGAMKVPHYVQRLELGSVKASPNTATNRTAPAAAMVDGDHGFGHVTVLDAMDLAIEMARETGVAFVGVHSSNHCGALSYFAARAIQQGVIGLVFTQTDKGVVPVGGLEPFCGTNPLCVGIPSRSGPPIILDMATSTVAGGHIYKARMEDRPIPPTWATDTDGNPTTDPHKAAYWTPAAGAKGYGLGVVIDVLTGIMCGGAFGPHIPLMFSGLDQKRMLCHLAGVIDPGRFAGREGFLDQVARMVSELHAVPAADGTKSVLAPGEPEYLTEQERRKSGIPLDERVWSDICALAGRD
jgi:ureidoglycolate dehydrogenase (NAD+)